jgi:hypothetical protein
MESSLIVAQNWSFLSVADTSSICLGALGVVGFHSNAIKFTHKGEVIIAVRVESPALNLAKEKMMKDLPFCPWPEIPKSRLCGSHHKPLQIQLQSNLPPSPGVRDFAVSLNELSTNPTLISEEVETIWLYCDIHDTGIGIPGMHDAFVNFLKILSFNSLSIKISMPILLPKLQSFC